MIFAVTEEERVSSIKDRLIELLESTPTDFDGRRNVVTIAEHLIRNGVLVSPLSIDDYVYQYNDILKEIHGYRIEEIKYFGKIFKSGFWYQAISKIGVIISFSELDIGKSVFLTPEEAKTLEVK